MQIKWSFCKIVKIKRDLKATISPGSSYNFADSDVTVSSARHGSAKLEKSLSIQVIESPRLQVVVSDSLESIVAMEIVPADVIGRVGGADPAKRHGAQLGLGEQINRTLNSELDVLQYIEEHPVP